MASSATFFSTLMESDDCVLLSTILEYKNKSVHVYLTSTRLIIEHRAKTNCSLEAGPNAGPKSHVIHLQEVIAVRADHRRKFRDKQAKLANLQKPYLLHDNKTAGSRTFSLFVVKRISKHRWRHKACQFLCHDYGTCQIWVDKIAELLKNPEWKRPKRLLVFVNPFGGKKRAPQIFNEKVRPLFELAGIYSEVIVTKRELHARDVIYEYDLQTIDGLVCVGGDGTFSELLNGLLDRTNVEAGVEQHFRHRPKSPSLRIGIIPAGSTDAIVYSLVGINDPTTSALQIILGDCLGLDVTALYKKEDFIKYTVTMSSYGYYGDLLKDSENLRWMGPKRYTWSGLKTFLANKSYEGEVSFLLASEEDSHPRDHSVCSAGCDKCRKAGMKGGHEPAVRDSQQELDPGATGDTAASCSRQKSFMRKDGWHHVKGKFNAISVVNISCRSDLSPMGLSPSSHLGDGCIDLILVQGCSRLQYLRHMLRIPNSKADQFDFEFIHVYRVKEFSFQPISEPEDMDVGEGEERGDGCGWKRGGLVRMSHGSHPCSVWNCDGEIVEHPSLYIQVHCQLIKLFGRGVEESNREMSMPCLACCCACDGDK